MIVCKNRFLLCLVILTTYQPTACLQWQRYVPAWFRMPTRKESVIIGAGLFVIAAMYFLRQRQMGNKSTRPSASTTSKPEATSPRSDPVEQPVTPPRPSTEVQPQTPAAEPLLHDQPSTSSIASEAQQSYDISKTRTYDPDTFIGLMILLPNNQNLPQFLVAVTKNETIYSVEGQDEVDTWMSDGQLFSLKDEILTSIPNAQLDNYKLSIAPTNAEELKQFSEQYEKMPPKIVLNRYLEEKTKKELKRKQELQQRLSSAEYQQIAAMNKVKESLTNKQLLLYRSNNPLLYNVGEMFVRRPPVMGEMHDGKFALFKHTHSEEKIYQGQRRVIVFLEYPIAPGEHIQFEVLGVINRGLSQDNYTVVDIHHVYQRHYDRSPVDPYFTNIPYAFTTEGYHPERFLTGAPGALIGWEL